eukprot:scaffold2144_cov334-Prasinococcus_capsulatus_cf.AAC.2
MYHAYDDRMRRQGFHGDLSEEEQQIMQAWMCLRHSGSVERAVGKRPPAQAHSVLERCKGTTRLTAAFARSGEKLRREGKAASRPELPEHRMAQHHCEQLAVPYPQSETERWLEMQAEEA